MPQYMLLIYQPVDGPPPDQTAADTPAWMEYTQGLQDASVMVNGAALQGLDTATTVRVRDDETQIVDGPFAETKEFLARPVLDVGAAYEAEQQAQAQA